jgi:hypothetical protein
MFNTFSMTDLAIIAVLLDEEKNNLKNINPKRRIWVHDSSGSSCREALYM